jgi:DNA-directed RNA polymerase subunit RPC12/RpoP
MPVKKKTAKKTTKKATKKTAPKKTYVCIPCGTEVTLTKEGMGVTRLMCCGEVMQPKKK